MLRKEIFSIEFPNNEKIRSFLSLKKLESEFSSSKMFEKTAAMIASRFPINSKIDAKIKSNAEYFMTWQKACSSMLAYLIGPAKFLERTDADELVCLPIISRILIGNSLQTIRAMNVYNSHGWVGTIFFKDSEFNNEFAFFGQNDFSSIGSWVSKVRADVQKYNLYGFAKNEVSFQPEFSKSEIIESVESFGNTITVHDVFSKIENLKNKYHVGNL